MPQPLGEWVGLNNDLNAVEYGLNAWRHFGTPPYEGGSFDQPNLLLDDLFMWLAVEARLRYEKDNPHAVDDGVYDPEQDPIDDVVTESIFN